MQQIGDVIQKHPDIGEAVNMYFSQVWGFSRSFVNKKIICEFKKTLKLLKNAEEKHIVCFFSFF